MKNLSLEIRWRRLLAGGHHGALGAACDAARGAGGTAACSRLIVDQPWTENGTLIIASNCSTENCLPNYNKIIGSKSSN